MSILPNESTMSTDGHPHKAKLLQHPKAPVHFDPSQQPVVDDDDGLVYTMPRPLSIDPVHVQALTGRLPADACAGCGEPMHLHYDTSGMFIIGCEGAIRRRSLGLVGLGDEVILGDQHPAVAKAIKDLLLTSCGSISYIFAEIRQDEQLQIVRTLATVAVRAYLKAEGK